MKKTILIVDDEKSTREGLARALDLHYRVLLAENAARALAALDADEVDVVLSDVRMPGMDGLELMRRARERPHAPLFILLTAYGSIETAVEAMRQGAYDFLTKPVNLDRLELLLHRALEARDMARENRRLKEQLDTRYELDHLIGRSPAMVEVIKTIRQVAPTRATVLIEGESGTGKELVAQALHRLSPRGRGPFVAVHCAALAPTLLESELFGHERGAFTGAVDQRAGRFELADGGTLLLDEIGEIDASVQVKILRVLEERRFERVGGNRTLEVDVRLLAATNRNLRDRVAAGAFREDLFFRLNVVSITLPPLRERPGDIPLLASRFVRELAAENGRTIEGVDPAVIERFEAHAWPGNVRELRNVIERMVVLSRGDRLTMADLPPVLRGPVAVAPAAVPAPVANTGSPEGATSATLSDIECQAIQEALRRQGGNRVRAARELGISRRTLHRKLNEYGLRADSPGRRGRPRKTPEPGDGTAV